MLALKARVFAPPRGRVPGRPGNPARPGHPPTRHNDPVEIPKDWEWRTGDLLAHRYATGSRPGARADPARLVLVIEGGSSRAAYGGGMAMAIEQLGLVDCFDGVYGVSAGALNAAWLLSARVAETVHSWWDPTVMPKVISPARALWGRPVIDTQFLVHTVYEELVPMDFARILAHPVGFHPVATDADTGRPTDLHPVITDQATLQLALRATTCMPLLAGPAIEISGRRYVDGGIAESVPIRTALEQGATHIVALRTKRADQLPNPPSSAERRLVNRYLRRQAPGAATAYNTRWLVQREDEELLATHPHVISVRPPEAGPTVSRTSRAADTLKLAVQLGFQATRDTLLTHLRGTSAPSGAG